MSPFLLSSAWVTGGVLLGAYPGKDTSRITPVAHPTADPPTYTTPRDTIQGLLCKTGASPGPFMRSVPAEPRFSSPEAKRTRLPATAPERPHQGRGSEE